MNRSESENVIVNQGGGNFSLIASCVKMSKLCRIEWSVSFLDAGYQVMDGFTLYDEF